MPTAASPPELGASGEPPEIEASDRSIACAATRDRRFRISRSTSSSTFASIPLFCDSTFFCTLDCTAFSIRCSMARSASLCTS